MSNPPSSTGSVSRSSRILILVTAFLGWMFAGFQLQITSLAIRSASMDLLARNGELDLDKFTALSKAEKEGAELSTEEQDQLRDSKALIQRWFSFCVCAFLFGAAAGGLVFGRLGDRIGRSKAMAAAILCYSILSGLTWFAQTPLQLLALRFLTCMGVGGMWPNGVALVSETWSNLSRPMIAGLIGTAANVGIFIMATLGTMIEVTPQHWQWVMLVGAIPLVLGLFVLAAVPESPLWLSSQKEATELGDKAPKAEVFRGRLLPITILGITLATIPLMGGWGVANWMMPWAGEAGEAATPPDPYLKAQVGQARSLTGTIGSFLGGIIASVVGRRRAYFISSLIALFCAQYIFWTMVPTDQYFLIWVSALGFFSGIFFGWLPLFLPELFPTRARSTGAGVSFNFGRILTAFAVLTAGALSDVFGGNYAHIGRVTSLIYAVGLVAIWFAPDTSQAQLDE